MWDLNMPQRDIGNGFKKCTKINSIAYPLRSGYLESVLKAPQPHRFSMFVA